MKRAFCLVLCIAAVMLCGFGCKKQEEEPANLTVVMQTEVGLFMVKVRCSGYSDDYIARSGQDLQKGREITFLMPEGTHKYTLSVYGKDEVVKASATFTSEFAPSGEKDIYLIVTGEDEAHLEILIAR